MQTAVVLAEMSNTFKALQAGLTVEGITMYLFWLGIVGMGAGAAYLFMMQGSLTKTYKKVAIVAGIICGVACFHYYRMAGIYVESLAMAISTDADGNIVIGELAAFPTAYRYIDWLITVPLMVLEFPLLLNLGKKGKPMFIGLGVLSLFMLVTAWIAETSTLGGASTSSAASPGSESSACCMARSPRPRRTFPPTSRATSAP